MFYFTLSIFYVAYFLRFVVSLYSPLERYINIFYILRYRLVFFVSLGLLVLIEIFEIFRVVPNVPNCSRSWIFSIGSKYLGFSLGLYLLERFVFYIFLWCGVVSMVSSIPSIPSIFPLCCSKYSGIFAHITP